MAGIDDRVAEGFVVEDSIRASDKDHRSREMTCLDLGRDCPGYVFAVGNHIPPNVPICNAEACMAAYRDLRVR